MRPFYSDDGPECCCEELAVAPSITPRLTELERLAGPSAP